MLNPKKLSLSTKAIHGKKVHPYKGPVSLPIYQTSTYRFDSSDDAIRYANGDPSVYVYSRYHNPTVHDVEEKIALMEGGDEAALFASGMAAISTAVFSFVGSGEEIVSTPALYGDVAQRAMIVLTAYFGGPSLEKVALIIGKK